MRVLQTSATWHSAKVEHSLSKAGLMVTEVADGTELLFCIDCVGQATILVDLDLPDMSWLCALREIRHRAPKAPVLAICSGEDLESEIKALSQGADEVLTPRMDPEEIVARVLGVTARRAGYSAAILRQGALTLDMERQDALWASEHLNLSKSEYQLLEHLALNPGQIIPKDRLIDQLYGLEDAPNHRIVDVFLCHLRKKLRAAGGEDAVIGSVHGQGLYLGDAERRDADRPEGRDWYSALRKVA